MVSSIMCLTLMVFHEAGNQPVKGKMATLEVVQNRVNSSKYPNSHCSVIRQKNQFSWVNSSNRSLNKIPDKVKTSPAYKKQWEESQEVVKKFLKSPTNYTNGAHFFNSNSLGVRYKTNVTPVRIGGHTFY